MKKLLTVIILLVSIIAYTSAKSISRIYQPLVKLRFDEGVKIRLVLGGKTYELQSYNLTYMRVDNSKGDVSTAVNFYQKSNINLGLRSSKIDQELLNWILSPEQQAKDGQIIVTDGETGKTLKTVNFTGANTASYNENNNTNTFSGNNQFSNFSISYKTISIKY